MTQRNPNPADGEANYNLGLCLRLLGREDEAYAALYKATWNQAWAGAGYHALAEIDCARQQGTRSWELRSAITLAALLARRGQRDAALDLLSPICSWFTEGADTKDPIEARALLERLSS